METNSFFNYNGKFYKSTEKVVSVDDRSFRYGDGCFETMKMVNGKIILQDYHVERLTSSLAQLHFTKINFFSSFKFIQQIIETAAKNKHTSLARIRITVTRGDGGLYDAVNNTPHYLIQTWALNNTVNELNENGLVIDLYKEARKSCDAFSNIKNNNYLPYVMAALWAKENKLNDALLLNANGNICDATIANVFVAINGIIQTPALTEGCVAGTMRRYILKCLRDEGMPVEENIITIADLAEATSLFFTSAIVGIKWVKQFGNTNYNHQLPALLHKKFIKPLFL